MPGPTIGIIFADHVTDSDLVATDVFMFVAAAAAGLAVFMIANFALSRLGSRSTRS